MIQGQNREKIPRLFLSYARSDREYAHKLERLLYRQANVYIFTPEMLGVGEGWESKLRNEISNCDIFLVLLSPNSIDSGWVLQELGAAWALDKPIVPIVTGVEIFSKIPVALQQRKFVEFKDLEKPEIVNRILEHYQAKENKAA